MNILKITKMIYIHKKEELNTFESIYTFSYKDSQTSLTASPDEIEHYKDILPCKEVESSPQGFKETLSNEDFFNKAIN
jgi:hypothetical protein